MRDRSRLLSLVGLCVLAVCSRSTLRADSQEDVFVTVGEEFMIGLESNPSTGYGWYIAESLPSWLVLIDQTWVADDPNVVGGPGTSYWTFRATDSGSVTLTFQYMRPWVGTPVDVHICRITATPPTDIEKVTVAVGEQFKVELRYCVACGYEWVLAGPLPSWLELVSDEQTPDPLPPGHVGGNGTETWTFRATGSGSTTLRFEYRPYQGGTPIKIHLCQVTAVPSTDPSLVLYLPFDEGAGATANDLSGYHNPGTVAGAAWVPGVTGTALAFVNGAHVTVPEIPAYDVTDAVSVLAWVKTTQSPNWGRILDKSEYQTSGFDLCLTAGVGLPRFEFFVNNTTSAVDGNTVVADGEWHFLAGTFGNKTLGMYVDGSKEAEAQSAGQVDINPNDWPIMVGAESSSNGGQQYFGSIDEVALYNRELSADEVMAIFQNGVPLTCQPEIDSIQIVRLQAAGNSFSEVGEVNEVTVGDFFTIKIEVTNRGSAPVPRPLLYEWIMSGLSHAEVVGQPHCLGLAMPPLQPGESLTLEPLCGGQAFQATQAGWATMDIAVGTCHQTFRFEIQPGLTPAPCQPEVTDVKIWRGRLVGEQFEKQEQVDKVAVGDLFQIEVKVTNRGNTTVNIFNLYGWGFSGPGSAQVVGTPCVGVYPIHLAPGESATLDAFCPASQAFQATAAGWATLDITVGTCHQTFRFEVTPVPCQPEVTDVKIWRGRLVGEQFEKQEQVDKVAVGDSFQIEVEVTNRGNMTVNIFNLYGWEFSGPGSAQVVGTPCVGVYPIHLAPGDSATLDAFCPASQAFQATQAGWATMDIAVGTCHQTFRFEITPVPCQPEVTDVKIWRGRLVGEQFEKQEQVDKVTFGDLFQIEVEVTNRGNTTVNMFNLYGWEFSGQGSVQVVGTLCVGVYPINLAPGESATMNAFCPASQAFQATQVGWVTMDITVGTCHQTFRFEIQPGIMPSPCQPEVTDVKIWRGRLVGGQFEKQEQVDKVAVGDLFQIEVEVTNRGNTTVNIFNLYGWEFSGQGSAQVVGTLCVGVYPINLAPGESATLDAFCPASQAFQATAAGWVTMDITVNDCNDSFTFEIE